MKHIILILISCLAIISCQTKTFSQTINNTQMSDTIVTIYRYGLPDFERLEIEQKIGEKWGVQFSEGGCIIDDKEMKISDKLNKKAYQYLENRHGKNWYERFNKEVEAALLKKMK